MDTVFGAAATANALRIAVTARVVSQTCLPIALRCTAALERWVAQILDVSCSTSTRNSATASASRPRMTSLCKSALIYGGDRCTRLQTRRRAATAALRMTCRNSSAHVEYARIRKASLRQHSVHARTVNA